MMTHLSECGLLVIQTFFLSVVMVAAYRSLALKWGWVDRPNDRKIHQAPMVTAGGVGILAALVLSFLLFQVWGGKLLNYREEAHVWLLFAASIPVLIVGLWDDLRDTKPFVKLGFHILAAVIFTAFRVTSAQEWQYEIMPLSDFLWTVAISTAWIVLLMNAINLIDGLDGLAAGTVAIAAFWLMLANQPMQNQFLSWTSALLLGGCLGFLVFNFNPARIFMGDTGAILLGLWIGAGSIEGDFKTISGLVLVTPIVFLAIPILEVVTSFLRRMWGGQWFFHADSRHMHHRLLKLGFSHRKIVLFYYGLTFLFGAMGFLLAPEEIDVITGIPTRPRIANPSMMYGILLVIGGAVLMASVALNAIERRIEMLAQRKEK